MIMKSSKNLFDLLETYSAEPDSFERLYSDFFTPVYRYIFSRLHDKEVSMDIVHNVFLKAFQHKESIRYQEGLRYLYTIARNQVIDHLRKKHAINLENFDEFIEHIPDTSFAHPEQSAISSDNIQIVNNLLGMLPQSLCDAVTLHYINELDYDEMSLITGKPESTLRQSVSRGLQKLQEYYKTYYDEQSN